MKIILHVPPPHPPSPSIEVPFGSDLKSLVPSLRLISTKPIKDEDGKDMFKFTFSSNAELDQDEYGKIDELCNKWMIDPSTRLANFVVEQFERPVHANQKQ